MVLVAPAVSSAAPCTQVHAVEPWVDAEAPGAVAKAASLAERVVARGGRVPLEGAGRAGATAEHGHRT